MRCFNYKQYRQKSSIKNISAIRNNKILLNINFGGNVGYLTLKYLHISCVLLSYSLFFVRGIWMLRASPLLQQRWVKVLPHIVDTVLLISAVMLAYLLSISPLAAPWLMVKIIALLLYILLGMIAIKRGKTRNIRVYAWIAAQLVFFYIVAVAISHNPAPWLAL